MNNPLTYIKPFVSKHEHEILMSMGIGGMIFSLAWGIKASFKAARAIDKYKETYGKDKLTAKETIKLTWKLYLPTVLSVAASVPCVIMSNKVSNKRYAAIATAYTISEAALQEYKDKTKEIIGEKKTKQIEESISDDRVTKTYSGGNQVILTGNGDSLFYEPLSGRYFKSNWNDILKAANELNSEAITNMSGQTTLNDWFQKIGLETTEIGETLGWNLMNNSSNLIDISISSHITKDNVPCGAIYYNRQPVALIN